MNLKVSKCQQYIKLSLASLVLCGQGPSWVFVSFQPYNEAYCSNIRRIDMLLCVVIQTYNVSCISYSCAIGPQHILVSYLSIRSKYITFVTYIQLYMSGHNCFTTVHTSYFSCYSSHHLSFIYSPSFLFYYASLTLSPIS